jgi:hypothetical protein
VRRRRNTRFEGQTPWPRRTPADANEREQSGEAQNHSPAMSHRNPRNSRREIGATLKIILANTKAMRHSEVRRQRRRRFAVRNGLSVLEFRSTVFLESYHLTSLSPLRHHRHAFELFPDGRGTAKSGVWVWQWVRFAKNEESLKTPRRIG